MPYAATRHGVGNVWPSISTPAKLDAMTTVVPLGDVIRVADEILDGTIRGRVVVDVNA